jgi:hypothetical protein
MLVDNKHWLRLIIKPNADYTNMSVTRRPHGMERHPHLRTDENCPINGGITERGRTAFGIKFE